MRVVVVGAGLSGLTAARHIATKSHEVVVLDKGRSTGGRCATRRIGDAVLDHGAQFFTVRSNEFANVADDWLHAGVAREWCRGFGTSDGHPRYCGTNGMTTITKHMARGLDVRCSHMVFSVERRGKGWRVNLDDGSSFEADAVVITSPIPQSMSLLANTNLEIPDGIRTIEYDKTIAALVVVDGDTNIPAPGGVQDGDSTFSFVADNMQKGVSPRRALTLHCNPSFSESNWWNDQESTHATVMSLAAEWIGGATIIEHQPKRWRMATPRTTWHERCWSHDGIFLAGDAFAGPRIEGAVLSGLAAAERVLG
ncbi:MAG: NAD(P)/FAD-dependent oxidoreductase [Ilumatobacteraceae bacterium]